MSPAVPERPLFIVGCPRSGTTLLSAMLHSHPRIAVSPETRFLLATYGDRIAFGDLLVRPNRRRLAEEITRPRRARFADLGLNRREVVADIVAAPPTLGSAYAAVWSAFARSRGKARWGDKRPAYWRAPDVLLRLFPDAQLVHVMRDPRSCVASLLATDWWRGGFGHAVATWLLAERELRRFRRRAPDGAYHLLRYEDLLADPRTTLQSLCEFLGEEFAEQMLDQGAAANDIVPARKVWHERTRGALDPARVDAWRHGLTPGQVRLLDILAWRRLAPYGYRPAGDGARPDAAEVAICVGWLVRSAVTLAFDKGRERWTRRREPNPVAAVAPRTTAPARRTSRTR